MGSGRGPLVDGAVKQFWSDVLWGEIDYMIVDLPPGTGDVPLTVLQSLPVDSVVIVSTPQDLSAMVVKKAVNMVSPDEWAYCLREAASSDRSIQFRPAFLRLVRRQTVWC